jgi:lycopene cyclase domain-containing protein
MDRFQYLIVLGICVLVTLPLEFVFDARVWRRPRRLAVALVPAFVLFVAWDLWATATGTWDFDPDYTIGVTLPGGMAIEELGFFLVVPICALLTIESVRNVLAGGAPLLARRDRARR